MEIMIINRLKKAACYKDKSSQTPLLFLAGINPSFEIGWQKILEFAADTAQLKDMNRKLPLHWACCNENSIKVAKLLVEKYSEAANESDHDGYTPPHHECRSWCPPPPDVIEEILKKNVLMQQERRARTMICHSISCLQKARYGVSCCR